MTQSTTVFWGQKNVGEKTNLCLPWEIPGKSRRAFTGAKEAPRSGFSKMDWIEESEWSFVSRVVLALSRGSSLGHPPKEFVSAAVTRISSVANPSLPTSALLCMSNVPWSPGEFCYRVNEGSGKCWAISHLGLKLQESNAIMVNPEPVENFTLYRQDEKWAQE